MSIRVSHQAYLHRRALERKSQIELSLSQFAPGSVIALPINRSHGYRNIEQAACLSNNRIPWTLGQRNYAACRLL